MALLDNTGTKVVSYSYNAWGKLLNTSGSMASTLGVLNPFRYRGYIYDEETGYFYLRSRYYYPNRCRFINADDVESLYDSGTLLSSALFTYCANNATSFQDSDGCFLNNFLKGVGDFFSDLKDSIVHAVVTEKEVNELKGSLAAIGISAIGTLFTIGITSLLLVGGCLTGGVVAVGAAIISGPFVLGCSIAANMVKEDLSDDAKINQSANSAEEMSNIGYAIITDLGTSIIEPVLCLNKVLSIGYKSIKKIKTYHKIYNGLLPEEMTENK